MDNFKYNVQLQFNLPVDIKEEIEKVIRHHEGKTWEGQGEVISEEGDISDRGPTTKEESTTSETSSSVSPHPTVP